MGQQGNRIMRVAAVGMVTVLVLGGSACGGDDGPAAAKATASREVRSSTSTARDVAPSSTVPSAPSAPTTTAAVAAEPAARATPAALKRPGDAAARLHAAWVAGDRAGARAYASPAAIDALFGEPPAGGFDPSECAADGAGHRCYFDGEGRSLVMTVAPDPRAGFRVTAARFIDHPAPESPAPAVVATPARAAVGQVVRLSGTGFTGEPWNAPGALVHLVRDLDGCALHAPVQHDLRVDQGGRLSGTITIPAEGDCRMSDRRAAVVPGTYQIAYACTACIVGELQVG